MRISKKGLYALEALINLAGHYARGVVKIHQIASDEHIPEKFLEAILVDLKTARFVESVRGAKGGYRLRQPPSKILLGDVIRTIDGPLAPFGDAALLRKLVARDKRHSALFRVFLAVRNSASRILDQTSLADLRRHAN